jgi:hypothetical protein
VRGFVFVFQTKNLGASSTEIWRILGAKMSIKLTLLFSLAPLGALLIFNQLIFLMILAPASLLPLYFCDMCRTLWEK